MSEIDKAATNSTPANKPDTKPASAAGSVKAETKVEAKPEPKIEAKPEPKVEAKPEPKVEPKATPKASPKPAASKPAKRGDTLAKLLALIAIIATAAVAAYSYQQLAALKTEIAKSLDGQEQILQKHDPSKKFDSFKVNIGARIDAIKQQEQQHASALAKLQDSMSKQLAAQNHSQRDWLLAEVKYLLNMANTRLRLLRDVNTATEALKSADARLASLNEPALFNVREQLATEISQLQAVGDLDGSTVALKLVAITKLVAQLPPAKLVVSADDSEQTPKTDSELLREGVVGDVARWIGLRRANRAYKALPQQQQVFYIDQLMRLEIEAARHAVLRFDEAAYNTHIQAATSLLKDNYDNNDQRVVKVLQELRELSARNVFVALPDISGSSLQLQRAMARYDGNASTSKE